MKRFRVYVYCDKLDEDLLILHFNKLWTASLLTKYLERKYKRPEYTVTLSDRKHSQVLNSGF